MKNSGYHHKHMYNETIVIYDNKIIYVDVDRLVTNHAA